MDAFDKILMYFILVAGYFVREVVSLTYCTYTYKKLVYNYSTRRYTYQLSYGGRYCSGGCCGSSCCSSSSGSDTSSSADGGTIGGSVGGAIAGVIILMFICYAVYVCCRDEGSKRSRKADKIIMKTAAKAVKNIPKIEAEIQQNISHIDGNVFENGGAQMMENGYPVYECGGDNMAV